MTVQIRSIIAALCLLVVGCGSQSVPELPSSTDRSTIVGIVTGPQGQKFLRDITAAKWNDEGGRAAELFAWIPHDAQSPDLSIATSAGQTAHAIASFLSGDDASDDPNNSSLWQMFARSLIPYLGATVGDPLGVAGFAPLDELDTEMRHSAAIFTAITKDAEANRAYTDAARKLAQVYEAAFAKAAVGDPLQADQGNAQRDILRAARLRGLIAAGAFMANPQTGRPTAAKAQTEVAYLVASLTARPGDTHINPEFFIADRLKSPAEISDADWSIYDTQLTVFLAPSPQINDAIRRFGRTYELIASGQ
jgi:hypothetical protein